MSHPASDLARDSGSDFEYIEAVTEVESDATDEYGPDDASEAGKELESDRRAEPDDAQVNDVMKQTHLFELNPPDISLHDADMLFDGNLHPPEHYQRGVEELDESAYDRKEYSAGTESLINMADERWRE